MLTKAIRDVLEQAESRLAHDPVLLETFRNCFVSTLETTTRLLDNGDTFLITGDIPAMWLRDSAAQVQHYLPFAKGDAELRRILEGLIRRQMFYINLDPYANAFKESDDGRLANCDQTDMNAWEWERKFEVDSLCYPVRLAWQYWKQTGRAEIFTPALHEALWTIVRTFRTEQEHAVRSTYRFVRPAPYDNGLDTETLQRQGRGMPVNDTGMVWSGFRPSDDACTFGFLIPANMFAVVVMDYMEEIVGAAYADEALLREIRGLRHDIRYGIEQYGIYRHPVYGPIYAYETDGFGNYVLMDDAGTPSLLSAPYLGYCAPDDPIYLNTRRFILSEENPYYFKGTAASGIGSPHTPKDYVWHLALSMEGLTAVGRAEQERLLRTLLATENGCRRMHEGFHKDDPSQFTRPWFAWSDSLFCELVEKVYGLSEAV